MFLSFLLPVCLAFLVFDLLRRLRLFPVLREILLIEAVIFGIAVVIGTEFLNVLHALATWGAMGWWAFLCLTTNYYRVKLPEAEPLQFGARLSNFFRQASYDVHGMILVIVAYALVLFAVALWATPNNYDSMTYHLARVAHWQQAHSINFYATNNPRQNYMPPWAEWAFFQLVLLQGDDRLVNLIQWLCYCGCLIGASLITELLGGSRRDGIIAAFFVGTMPAAIFEATSTQNDLVMSFWLMCIVYGCIKLSRDSGYWETLFFGASIGLALLTKTVTLIFAAPLFIWGVWVVSKRGPLPALSRLAILTLIVLALNTGPTVRNLITSGHVLGPQEHDIVGNHYTNDVHDAGAIFSNILRNLSLHANLFHEKSTAEQLVITIHKSLGLDPQDPRTTFNGGIFSIWEGGEDGTPMPIHLGVIALSFITLVINYRRFSHSAHLLALSIVVGAFLFCVILKWQPFHARLHLALFVMSAPLAGLVLGGYWGRFFAVPLLFLFFLMSLPDVSSYPARPVLGPCSVFTTSNDFQQLFRQPALARPYLEAIQLLEDNNVQSVGLIWKEDDWEYPLLVSDRVRVPWRVDHVLVENAYAPLESTEAPDALLSTRPGSGDLITYHDHRYRLVRSYVQGPTKALVLSIYLPDNTSLSTPTK